MSKLIKEIENGLADANIDLEKIIEYEQKLVKEYNIITEKYRILFRKIDTKQKIKRQKIIDNCSHNYIMYSEYHNDKYFVCDKCGHETY